MNSCKKVLWCCLFISVTATSCTTIGSNSNQHRWRKSTAADAIVSNAQSNLLEYNSESAAYYYGIAKLSLLDNDLGKALDLMKLAIEQDPHSSFLNYRLGLVYLDLARDPAQFDNDENLRFAGLKRAEYYLENAQVIDPDDSDILIALAETKSFLGLVPSAIDLYEQALKLKPEYVGLLKEIASELYRIERFVHSLEYIRDYLKVSPDDPEGNYIAGLNYVKLNELEKARPHLEKTYERNPYNADLVINLGAIYESSREYDLAEKTYKTIANISPKDSIFYRKFVGMLLLQKKYDEARKEIESIIEYDSEDYIWPYYLGLTYEQTEQFEKALPYFQKAYEMSRGDSRVIFDLTFTLLYLNHFDEALQILNDSIQRYPRIPGFYLLLGDVYNRERDYDKALEIYQKGLDITDDKGEFLFQIAIVQERKKDLKNAEKTLLQLLNREPKHDSALNFLGYIYAEKGIKLKKAEELINRALKIQPDNGAYLDSLGWVHYKQKKYQLALKKLLRANALLDSSDTVVIDHIGATLKALGCYAKAHEAWSFILSKEPENQNAADNISQIDGLKDLGSFDCDSITLSLSENEIRDQPDN